MKISMDIEHAVAVRVCSSLHENATAFSDLEDALDAAGIGGFIDARPAVTSPAAAFSAACARVSRKYVGEDPDQTRILSTTVLARAGKGSMAAKKEVKYAVNIAAVVDEQTNDLAQIGWFSFDPTTGTTNTHTKPDVNNMFTQKDLQQFYEAAGYVEEYTANYGDTCTSKDVRNWLTDVCQELQGWMHIGQKGDYIIVRRPEMGDEDPGRIMLSLKGVLEGINPKNIVSVMPLFPDPATSGELRVSAQNRVLQEIGYAISALEDLREGGKFTKRGINSQYETFNQLQARVDFYARSLEFRATELDELITGAKNTLQEMQREEAARAQKALNETMAQLEEEL